MNPAFLLTTHKRFDTIAPMYIPLPQEYVEQQFRIYAGYSKVNSAGIFEGGCPICREGKSWGKKRRLFYIPDYDNIHCKNCHRSWNTLQWIIEVSGKSYQEVKIESKEYEYISIEYINTESKVEVVNNEALPLDAINLSDPKQLEFYKHNHILKECIKFITKRRIHLAINKPKSLYLSLTDYIHKNRLCIPFTNDTGTIEFYQTRSFIQKNDDPLPKYLGKAGGNKTLFGADQISEDLDYIFIFEGPIDAMFVQNGVAIGGVTMTSEQKNELNKYPFHEKIWVLDNQHIDQTSKEISHTLLDQGETIFIWPKIDNVKDVNDVCMLKNINELPTTFIVKNSFTGIKGKFQMKKLGI